MMLLPESLCDFCPAERTFLAEDSHTAPRPSPAINNDINFFLDFEFQSLYTFISRGFSSRASMKNGKGRIELWQPRKKQRKRRRNKSGLKHKANGGRGSVP